MCRIVTLFWMLVWGATGCATPGYRVADSRADSHARNSADSLAPESLATFQDFRPLPLSETPASSTAVRRQGAAGQQRSDAEGRAKPDVMPLTLAPESRSEPPAAEVAESEEIAPGRLALGATGDDERQAGELTLADVLASVDRAYPLLEAALYARQIAAGDHLAAHGAFDTKLKGASENSPVGFYETYRQNVGIEQPLLGGGQLFGGYRIGRGQFQPWYLERQTDEGGEFKAGLALPLARNVAIDARRAQLWRTAVGRELAEPEIRAQRIDFLLAASYAYWDWVAAGQRARIARALLDLAEGRNEAIRRKVETGDSEPPVLQDNRRLIVSREAKVIEAERKLEQAAIKLSLFLRNARGEPILAEPVRLPEFPDAELPDAAAREADVAAALENRPELRTLRLMQRQLEIDLAQARNEMLPEIQAVVTAAQDVGTPATSKDDKSEFELEAGMYLDVPLQRRKALGKATMVQGKLQQTVAKARMTQDKIVAEVQAVYAALQAAHRQIERARESRDLAARLAEIERRKFELGESDLLSVNLREQQAAEAEGLRVGALYEYFTALADYRAALAFD